MILYVIYHFPSLPPSDGEILEKLQRESNYFVVFSLV